jgi:hypothetical protein
VISRFNTFKHVYSFFDVSSCSYEVYPEELFHCAFPYFLYGNLFVIQDACFYKEPHQPVFHSQSWPGSIVPSACVPALWSRRARLGDGSGWGETQRLIFDNYLTLKSAKQFPHEFWNTVQSLGPLEDMHAMIEESAVLPEKMSGPRGTRLYLRNGDYISPFDEGYVSESEESASLYHDDAVYKIVHNGTTYYIPVPGIQQLSSCISMPQGLELNPQGLQYEEIHKDINDFACSSSSYDLVPRVSSYMPNIFAQHLSSHSAVPESPFWVPNVGEIHSQIPPPLLSLYQNIGTSIPHFAALDGQDVSSKLLSIGKVQDWINNIG